MAKLLLGHGGGGTQNGVHGVRIKLTPEFHQLIVGQSALGTGDGRSADGKDLGGIVVAITAISGFAKICDGAAAVLNV